jgi:predicted transport protein
MKLFSNNIVYDQFQFNRELEFEREVVLNSKLFFGSNSIYIDAKRKITTKAIGNSIPDGFLFDLSDKDNPEFYIVEVELATHDFYNHIFPQITKFFGFYKNPSSQNELVEKIFTFINNDIELRREFKNQLGERELYKFVKDTIQQSQNILLIIDGDKKELPEIMETYSDTWGKMVILIQLKKFSNKESVIYTMHPEFEDIEFVEIEDVTSPEIENIEVDENYHLGGVSDEVRQIYKNIKNALLLNDPDLVFNPTKKYISIRKEKNIAFFLFRRKKIILIVLQSEDEIRKQIKENFIKSMKPNAQRFWNGNGQSCAIILDKVENLDEIIILLGAMVSKS